ncbi:MAG TPA: hypothetical protein PLQ11_03475, partial [Beijerinckiaceae bacterium]|nr:hypothetical protein [Beijerinckiaceae bacterium]
MALRGKIAFVALLAAGAALAQQTQKSPAAPVVQTVAGGYDLTSADGSRKCLMLLRPADSPGGHALGFPAPCRLAFPLLVSVAAWS